ncbi:fimbria/pilus periplasmic chaperone [Aurantiacibacter odishensis]|uniref:fimbria/pilus periplasmic chaperone n=1 Tax=Aurantiacibacter odishensis TaxID=1155476 RepID=UPI000E71B124|nr:fimbria/pilus periplasmic chaperone [Aurantiacibacter odishensis]
MIAELEPAGRNSILRVTVTNDGDRDTPYEVLMLKGEITPDGELLTTPADDQFLVFPTQTVVEARSQQVFRVQYIGDPELVQSEVYYMGIRQVPVASEDMAAQVQLVVNYNVLINVVPRNSVAQPSATGMQAAMREDVAGIEFVAGNEGTRFYNAGLSEWTIAGKTIDGEDYEVSYDRGELSRAVGVGVVAPGRTRNFFIPTEVPLQPETVQIEIRP